MPQFVRELKPARVVSLIQPELEPAMPPELNPTEFLRVAVHDVSEEHLHHIVPDMEAVSMLIDFIDDWNPADGALLAHCYAGVSRSTATALIAATMKTGDPDWAALRLRTAAPHAAPNRLIVQLADERLGLNGTLVEARRNMGESVQVVEGPLTVLRIGAEQFG